MNKHYKLRCTWVSSGHWGSHTLFHGTQRPVNTKLSIPSMAIAVRATLEIWGISNQGIDWVLQGYSFLGVIKPINRFRWYHSNMQREFQQALCSNGRFLTDRNVTGSELRLRTIKDNLERFSSLWPSDVIWQQRSGSTLFQEMACMMAPTYYHNQYWLITSEVFFGLIWGQFHQRHLHHQLLKQALKFYFTEISFNSSRGQWVKSLELQGFNFPCIIVLYRILCILWLVSYLRLQLLHVYSHRNILPKWW